MGKAKQNLHSSQIHKNHLMDDLTVSYCNHLCWKTQASLTHVLSVLQKLNSIISTTQKMNIYSVNTRCNRLKRNGSTFSGAPCTQPDGTTLLNSEHADRTMLHIHIADNTKIRVLLIPKSSRAALKKIYKLKPNPKPTSIAVKPP